MKKIIGIAFILLTFCQFSFATNSDDRKITKGTILNYAVKEGAVSYKLKITVAEWNTLGNIKLQWQTTGAKASKGVCTFPFAAIGSATAIKIKMKPGNEVFKETDCRWFIGYSVYDDLFSTGIESDVTVDGKDVLLLPDPDDTEHEILYNNAKTTVDYANATGDADDKEIKIGIIEFTETVALINNFDNGIFSMQLTSIQTPKTLEEKMAKQIMDAMAPKGKVALKKMDAAKFAKVKVAYPLLATLENYDATKGGTVAKPIAETYEFRVESNTPNPPSLIDCLTADLKILYKQKEKYAIADVAAINDKELPSATAKKILEVYTKTRYNDIPGYRPWTHWRFVNSLTENQRVQLATELQSYIATYGFSE